MRLYSEAWSFPTWSTFPSFTSTLSHISGMQILGGGSSSCLGRKLSTLGELPLRPPPPLG